MEEQIPEQAPAEGAPPPAAPSKGKGLWIGIAVVVIVVLVLLVAVFAGLFAPAPAEKLQIELWYNNDGHYGDTEDELATVLQQSIQACGKVDVTLKSDTWAVFAGTNLGAGTMPLFLLGWYPDYFDSDNYISPFLTTSGAASLGSLYSDATMDQWISDEQTTTDTAVRADRFSKIQNKLAEEVLYIPLFSGNAHVAYVTGVTDVVLHPVTFKWFIMNKPGATELRASTNDKIVSLDPASAYDYMSIEIINQVFDTLLVYEPRTATVMSGLAGLPTVSPDGLTYAFTLKPNLQFQDGTALNATVVKRAIERVIRLDIPGSAAFLLYDVGALGRDPNNANNPPPGTIEVGTNDLDITFHLSRPVSFFPELMAFSAAAPVPWDYDQTGEQPSTVGSVVGSGPYRLTQHVANQLVVLERNPTYHAPGLYASFGIPTIPVMDRVTIDLRLTATALKTDIETKAVDVAYRTLTPTDLTDLQNRAASLGITVDLGASPQIRYLVFNVNKVPDVQVRKAIAYSISRADIDNVVFQGTVEPLYSMIPSNMPFHSPVFQTAYGSSPNCNSANTLLAELGFFVDLPTIWVAGVWIARDI